MVKTAGAWFDQGGAMLRPRFSPILALIIGLLLVTLAPVRALAGGLGDDVLAELNYARTHPYDYAQGLRSVWRPNDPDAEYANGAADNPRDLSEAIVFLEHQRPLKPLKGNPRLAAAAQGHATLQGPRGEVGHAGIDGASLSQRLQREGVWAGLSGENISYGYADARDVVRQLIIDSGVAGRGHRQNIFDPAYSAAGVGCGRHRVYGAMCVIDFAGAIVVR
jgi:hypothetical protein